MLNESDILNALTVESENDELTTLDLSGSNNVKLVSTGAVRVYDTQVPFVLEYDNLNFNLSSDIEIVSPTTIKFKPKSVYRLFHAYVKLTGGGVDEAGRMNVSLYMDDFNRLDLWVNTRGDTRSYGSGEGMFSIPPGVSPTLELSTRSDGSTSSCYLDQFEAFIKFL